MKKYCCILTNGIGDRMKVFENYLKDHDPSECDFYWLRNLYHSNYNPNKYFDIDVPLTIVNMTNHMTDNERSISDDIISKYNEKNIYDLKIPGYFTQVPPLFPKYFKLKKCVTQLVDDLELTDCIGIHLRSYEAPKKFHKNAVTRSDELNNILIKSATDIMTPDNRYFIASDSQYILNYFKTWEKVTIIPTIYRNGYCNRNSEDAFYFDLCNLYALSQCKMIYRTYGGFALLAGAWGSKPIHLLSEGFK